VRSVRPRAAPQDAILRNSRLPCAAVCRRTVIGGMPRVLAPLPNVAMHIIKAPGVRLFSADRWILALRIRTVPSKVFEVLNAVAEAVARVGIGPASVFPLGFRRQTNDLFRLQ